MNRREGEREVMTYQEQMSTGLLGVVLRALPRAARAEEGPELAAIFAEATAGAGAGRLAVLREAADVAGHGLRLRFGLGRQGRADEIVARAAPLAVAIAAAQGLIFVVALAVMLWYQPQFDRLMPGDRLVLCDAAGATVAWLVVLALLCAGRWGAARILATLGTLAQVPVLWVALPMLYGARSEALGDSLLPSLFVWLVLIAAPRDLVGPVPRRDRRALVGVALLALVPYGLMLVVHFPDVLALTAAFVWLVPIVAGAALSRRGGTGAAAFGLAAVAGLLRLGVPMLSVWVSPAAVAGGGTVLVVLAAGWRRWSRRAAGGRAVRS